MCEFSCFKLFDSLAQTAGSAVEGMVVCGQEKVKAGIGQSINECRRCIEAGISAVGRRAYRCLKIYNSVVGKRYKRLDCIETAGVIIVFAAARSIELSLMLHGITYKNKVGLAVAENKRG